MGFASLLNDIASEMIYPLLGEFLLSIGGTKSFVGLLEGAAESLASFLKLFAGAWSDRVGQRRHLAIAGYVLAALARPVMGMVAAPWQALGLRLADRVGKGIRTSPRDALIADSTPQELRGRAFGFHRSMDHLGAAIGPLLATAFLYFWPGQLRPLFLVTIVPGLAVVGLLAIGLKEPPRAAPPAQKPLRLSLAPFDGRFRTFLAALFLFTLGNSTDMFLLVRASELGVPQYLLPMLWLVFHVVKSSGNLAGGGLVDRVGPRWPLVSGWLIYAVVYASFAAASQAWHAWVLFCVYGLYYAVAEPAEKTLVTQLGGAEHQGLAFGWYHFAIGIAALPASVLFGLLYQRLGATVAFSTGAGLALAALAVLLFVRENARLKR